MAATQQSWSDIPLELAGLVLGRLPAHVDRVRIAAVCPQWRSAVLQVRLPPPPPLLALKRGGTFYSMPRGEPLHFPGCEERFATVSGSWLVYHRLHCLLLVDPFTGATMTLPAPSSVHLPGDGGDSKGGNDSANDVGDDSEDGYDSMDGSDALSVAAKYFEVIKLIVCSPDLVAAILWSSENNWIAVCRPGASLWSVAWDHSLWITDIAFYQGKLYALDYGEDLLALDISVDDTIGNPRVARIGQVIKINHFDNPITFKRMLYLVESGGSLLLVRRRTFHSHVNGKGHIHTFAGQCEPDVAIFEADFGQSQWSEVTSLEDDQALFLGPCSRAVHMPKGDLPGNRVWFLDDYKDFHLYDEYDEDSSCSGTSGMANHRMPFCPLPMISWGSYQGHAGAAWLFPSN
ncbi:unnamed protein product [Urochloa decumbens]|uniref:F-box domain-containing protein n=1 Tax=Urochloa decumbens TaxID=240449 RepID=A0ABC9B2W5_9POAL